MKHLLIFLFGLVALLASADRLSAQGATIIHYVAPGGNDSGYCTIPEQPCQTISYALTRVSDSAEIRVAAGIYSAPLLVSNVISLTGGFTVTNWITPSWTTNLTILDGQKNFRPLTIWADKVRVDGFVVRNGNATFFEHMGGGIFVGGLNKATTATLVNLRIENNIASTVDGGEGGGLAAVMGDIFVNTTNITLENVSFISNTASSGHLGAIGGGLSLQATGGSRLDVAMNKVRIEGNRAGNDFSSSGGGLALTLNGGTASLQQSFILSNSAALSPTVLGGASRGGGIYLLNGNLALENVLLAGNAGERGDAISIQATGQPSVTLALNYVTLANNYRKALDASAAIHGEGNELYLRLNNTLLSGNPTAFRAAVNSQPISLTLRNTLIDNDVFSLTSGKVTVVGTPLRGAAGYANVASGNYHLSAPSAAIDKGNNLPPFIDLAGVARPSGPASEIGAYEFVAIPLAEQTISFAAVPDKQLGDPAFPVTATASSGLPVRVLSNTPTVCTVNGATVTLLASGICTISARQEGNERFQAASPVLQSFTIRSAQKSNQTVTFAPLVDKVLGEPPFPLTATASSGLAVRFVSDTPGVCAVNGITITLIAIGECAVTATQEGNAGTNPAPPVTQRFTVTNPGSGSTQKLYLPVVKR